MYQKQGTHIWHRRASIARPQEIVLSEYGKIVDDAIRSITKHYSDIIVDKYVIMPYYLLFFIKVYTARVINLKK